MPKFKVGDKVSVVMHETIENGSKVEIIEEVINYEDGDVYKLCGDGCSYEEHELKEAKDNFANKLREKSEAVLRAKRESEEKRVQERLGAILKLILSECERKSEEGKFEAFFNHSLFAKETEDKYVDGTEVDSLLLKTVEKELKKEGFEITTQTMSGQFLVKW